MQPGVGWVMTSEHAEIVHPSSEEDVVIEMDCPFAGRTDSLDE
jgi:hypothetical protein